MDIEGAEYAVLEKLVHDGTITLVSELMVEFIRSNSIKTSGRTMRSAKPISATNFLISPLKF
jgi:hypothetical protein